MRSKAAPATAPALPSPTLTLSLGQDAQVPSKKRSLERQGQERHAEELELALGRRRLSPLQPEDIFALSPKPGMGSSPGDAACTSPLGLRSLLWKGHREPAHPSSPYR